MANLGFTAEQNAGIADFWNKNSGDPQAIMDGMIKYGVNAEQLASAIGKPTNSVGNYLVDGGADRGFGGYSKGITDTYTASASGQANAPQASPGGNTIAGPSNAAYGSNLGFSSQQTQQQNPYLDQQAQAITNQMNNNWTRNLAPSIRSGAMAAGGFGGSRQGVVEANGLNDLNQGLGNSLANLYGGAWNQQQSNNLQQQSINNQGRSISNSYDLGLRSSDLGFANLDANIYQNNFGNQMNAAQFGMNAYNTMGNQNTNATNAANTVQNQPLNYFNNASDKTNGVANGYGSQTSSQTMPGNTMAGVLGGAQLGSQLYNQFMGPSVQDNGYSTGTGSAYAGTTDSSGAWTPNRRGM